MECNFCGVVLTDENRAQLPDYPGTVAQYCQRCADEDAAEYAADAAAHANEPAAPRRRALWQELEDADVDEENLLPRAYRPHD